MFKNFGRSCFNLQDADCLIWTLPLGKLYQTKTIFIEPEVTFNVSVPCALLLDVTLSLWVQYPNGYVRGPKGKTNIEPLAEINPNFV